ncbi:MAG: tetratricopeptide repeat protein [Burkholderiaceae bacterium]
MRFAETLMRCAALAALCVGMTGCASLTDAWNGFGSAKDAPPATPAPAASTTTTTSAPGAVAAPAPAPAEVLAPVDANAQRAFDAARRLLAAGRTEEAERAFAALAKSNPELGGAHANLGLIYSRAGKTDEAVAALEQAVRASPKQPLFHNQLGIAYRQQGQFAKARGAYEKALDLDPNYAAACLNLGILFDLYLRDGKRALELYDRYLALPNGKDPAVTKWVADLKNRKPAPNAVAKKEQS